jgi:general secretion pathway protein D
MRRGVAFAPFVLAALFVACDGGVTPDCPAMPTVDPVTGEPAGPTRYDDPTLGPGGALNRWQVDAAAQGCATLPSAAGGSAAGGTAAGGAAAGGTAGGSAGDGAGGAGGQAP